MADNETTTDIIAEIRALSNPISDGIIAINGKSIADRFEAAHKRERGDAAKLREAIMEIRRAMMKDSGAGPATELHATIDAITQAALAAPPRNCDAAKLREALKRIVAASIVAKNANAPEWILQRMADIFAMATTALSASPRNCDVGTAKEQAARFFALCNSNKCSLCPCRFTEKTDCALIWAQMPYEEGGDK